MDRIRIGYQPIRLFFTILRRYADIDMNIEMDKNTATDSITSRLADAKNDLGITQKDLASATGISVKTIINIETKQHIPSLLYA